MNTFTLYWRGGDRQVVHGDDTANAMTRPDRAAIEQALIETAKKIK